MLSFTRRSWLRLAGLGTAATAGLFTARNLAGQQKSGAYNAMSHGSHAMGPVGRVSTEGFNPTTFLRSWNFSDLPPDTPLELPPLDRKPARERYTGKVRPLPSKF